jgi:hypothetical protein
MTLESVKKKYFDRLYGRVIKILYMYEEEAETLDSYIESLSREMVGSALYFKDEELIRIVGVINGLDKTSHHKVRKDILDSCKIVEELQRRYE